MLMLCSTSQSCTFKMCINQADFFLKNYSYLQPIDKFFNLKESTKGCEKSSLSVCVSQQASKWHCLICHTAAKSTTASASFLPLCCIQNKSVCRSITFRKSLTLLSWLEPGNISCPSFYFFIAKESTWGKDWNWCTLRHTNCNSTCITYTHWFITKYCHLTSNCITEATCSNVNSNTRPIQEYNLYYKFDLNYQQISEILLSDLWPNILFLQICI